MSVHPLSALPQPAPADGDVVNTDSVAVHRRIQPMPALNLSRMTHYRGGTYSHTVDTIVFVDGTSARTDLIRLNPNIDAYSLDFAAAAPTTPSRYRADSWSAVPHLQTRAHEAEVDWILRNSYPARSIAQLSHDLRAAGYPLGSRNVAEHEAIAATQAAIWSFTNGLELDNRPLNVPVRVTETDTAITVEFDGPRQLASFTATVSSTHGAVGTLQKSLDGQHWQDVAASRVTVEPGITEIDKRLGVGATMTDSGLGVSGSGYRHYRVTIDGDARVSDLAFRLDGSRNYRNSESVVYLYNYLLAGARAAREAAVTPTLIASAAVVDGDLIGPFTLITADSAAVKAADGYAVVDAAGAVIDAPLQPGSEFFVRAIAGGRAVTLTIEVPGNAGGFGGRVITGVAHDEVGHATPLALAVPAQLVVEFDLEWVEALAAAQ